MFPEISRDDVFRLETRRLWLRWPARADAAALAAVRSNIAATTPQPVREDKDESGRRIERWRERNAAGHGMTLVMTGRGDDRTPFGLAAIEPILPPGAAVAPVPHRGAARITLQIDPGRWANGFATEAAQALIDVTFVLSAASAFETGVRVTNPGARRVLERCGFAYETSALQREHDGLVSCDCFRLDRKTWASLKQWRMPGGLAPSSRPAPQHAAALPGA